MVAINLEGKNALVCGGSKGIGKATAMALAEAGAQVTILSRNIESLRDTYDALPNKAGQIHSFIPCDLSDHEDLNKKISILSKQIKIHILVNNTGGPPAGPIAIAEPLAFMKAFEMHLMANQIITQALLPNMKEEGYGRVINVISTSVKQPLTGLGVSNTIRGAVANWAKTLANEVSVYGITVNNVLPGATSTERLDEIIQNKSKKQEISIDTVVTSMQDEIPMKRFAEPAEIANAILFIASPLASYITGINLPVDGGRTKSL